MTIRTLAIAIVAATASFSVAQTSDDELTIQPHDAQARFASAQKEFLNTKGVWAVLKGSRSIGQKRSEYTVEGSWVSVQTSKGVKNYFKLVSYEYQNKVRLLVGDSEQVWLYDYIKNAYSSVSYPKDSNDQVVSDMRATLDTVRFYSRTVSADLVRFMGDLMTPIADREPWIQRPEIVGDLENVKVRSQSSGDQMHFLYEAPDPDVGRDDWKLVNVKFRGKNRLAEGWLKTEWTISAYPNYLPTIKDNDKRFKTTEELLEWLYSFKPPTDAIAIPIVGRTGG